MNIGPRPEKLRSPFNQHLCLECRQGFAPMTSMHAQFNAASTLITSLQCTSASFPFNAHLQACQHFFRWCILCLHRPLPPFQFLLCFFSWHTIYVHATQVSFMTLWKQLSQFNTSNYDYDFISLLWTHLFINLMYLEIQ